MRVLVVSHTYVTRDNRRKLEILGAEAEVLALVPNRGQDVGGVQELGLGERREGYVLEPLPIRGTTWPGTRWVFTRARAPWRRFRPDVALIEQEPWSFALWQALALRWAYAPRSALVLFSWESQPRPGWKEGMSSLFYRAAIRNASAILVGNRDARDLFLRHGADPRRVVVMPQVGLDADRLRPLGEAERRGLRSARGLPQDAFLVGFSGRLVPEKGLVQLMDATESLAREGVPARLMVIGDGPLRALIEERVRARAPIELLAPVPREELAPFYQALDVFVLPSLTTSGWKEQFGMALAEAMACGIAVVGSTSGAIPDVMGRAGLLYAEGDGALLTDALRRLASDPRLREELGRRGRERSARLYSHEAVAAQTMAALRRATGAAGPAPIQYCDLDD